LLMFLTLGLLVNPHELIPIIVPALIISFLMVFISRPLSVFLCLLPFRKMTTKDKAFISWVGLRGAVPIIFAIIPLAEEVPEARFIFNIVFFCTLVSLLLQGTSLAPVAKWMGLVESVPESVEINREEEYAANELKSISTELFITDDIIKKGNRLMDLALPENAQVVMVKREHNFFVPTGSTILKDGDVLMVISDNQELLPTAD